MYIAIDIEGQLGDGDSEEMLSFCVLQPQGKLSAMGPSLGRDQSMVIRTLFEQLQPLVALALVLPLVR